MKITEVEIFDVSMTETRLHWNPVIVRIHTDEGISGVGEVALAYGACSAAGVGMVKTLAERYLIGANPFQIERLWDLMFRQTFWAQGGGPVVYGGMSGIDEALWDIKGKALGVPVYELLGGTCWDKLRVYANGWQHGCVTYEQWRDRAAEVAADGYTALKFDPFAHDREGRWIYSPRAMTAERAELSYQRVKAVREGVGPDVDILIEVHGNLGTTSAIQIGQRLEEFKPFFYEEPVDAMNVECMRKVGQNVNIPIAAGERLYTRYGFRQYIEGQVLDILQPDIGLAGGISETKKIATYAETYDLHVQPHNCASPVATGAAVHLDCCIPNFIIQEWFPYHTADFYSMVKDPYEPKVVDGYLPIPTEPGLGIELDDAVLAKYGGIHVK